MKTYTTKAGDMWDGIAFEQLGSENAMGKLMEANQEYLDLYIFPAGVVLNLPEITEPVSASLPPWKRSAT